MAFQRTAAAGWSGTANANKVTVTIGGQEYDGFTVMKSAFPGTGKNACKATGLPFPRGCQIAFGKGPAGLPCAVIYPQSTAAVTVAQAELANGGDLSDNTRAALASYDGPLPPDVHAALNPTDKAEAPKPAKKFRPDNFQKALIDAFLSLALHLVCMAGAGSGKSTVQREMIKAARASMPQAVRRVLFLMFNAKNREETTRELRKLPPAFWKDDQGRSHPCTIDVATFHSFGKQRIEARFPGRDAVQIQDKPKKSKMEIVAEEQATMLGAQAGIKEGLYPKHSRVALELARKAKAANLCHTQRAEVVALIASPLAPVDLNGCESDAVVTIACGLLKLTEPVKGNKQVIDFSDMPWWLARGFEGIDVPAGYDAVFVDEAQDMNPAYHEIVRRLEKTGSRIIVVGDQAQAINGFAGAACSSIPQVIEILDGQSRRGKVKEFPMPVNYRCSRAVVEKANMVPGWEGLQASDDAIQGETGEVNRAELLQKVQPGDACIARVNSVLIDVCLSLIESGKPVNLIGGGDAAKDMVGIVDQVARRPMPIGEFLTALDAYERSQEERLGGTPGMGMKLEAIKNQAQCCRLIAARQSVTIHGRTFHLKTSADLVAVVMALIVDDKADKSRAVNVMTAHKCKGLQFKTVFNLTPSLFPHPKCATAEQETQEYNLLGVLITRAEVSQYDLIDEGEEG